MTLPFDTQQFLTVFVAYNAAIWPAQILAYILGAAALAALFVRHPLRERVVLASLSILWAWNGLVYQLAFFAPLNPAAFGFAALFLVQAIVLARRAFSRADVRFEPCGHWRTLLSFSLVVYALLIYELLGVAAGHGLMQGPLFGVAPCPTTIFTIGLLLMGQGRAVKWLAAIPLAWAAIGTSAAVLLGIPEDVGLGVAGVILAAWLVVDGRKRRQRDSALPGQASARGHRI